MKSRHKRAMFIVLGLAGVALIATLVLKALQSNINHFFSPTEVMEGKSPVDRTFRLGGLVEKGSVQRDGVMVHFTVTDNVKSVPVVYSGILPDLFREGEGVVAQGKMGGDGLFAAEEVLAKHDETYMPPEVAKALDQAQSQTEQSKQQEATGDASVAPTTAPEAAQ
jgi:cytochrome c-type biogenesis protein CcmE